MQLGDLLHTSIGIDHDLLMPYCIHTIFRVDCNLMWAVFLSVLASPCSVEELGT